MAMLNWVGPEVGIGRACSIAGFVVESLILKEETGGVEAEGSLTTIDYGEHCWDFTRPWSARRELVSGVYRWIVNYEDNETVLIGGNYVTAKAYLHVGVSGRMVIQEEKWIVAMIEELMTRGREVLEVKEYDRPREVYEGTCVCRILSQPLPPGEACHSIWLELTKGNFPVNCFQCSCGQRWHCADKKWSRVSKKAFELLTRYNGRVMRLMVMSEGIACFPIEVGGHWL